jgi:hypothetical protein
MQSIIVDESSGKSGGIVAACGNRSRDKNIKHISCGDDPEMMFNLEIDPNEQNNLAGNPRYAKTLATMRAHVAIAGMNPISLSVLRRRKKTTICSRSNEAGCFPIAGLQPTF